MPIVLNRRFLFLATIDILIHINSTEEVYIRGERVTRKGVLDSYEEGISTQKRKYKLLRIASHIDFPKVRTFLESVARGSKNSKGSYEVGLKHLQCFLNSISSNDNNNNNSANDYHSSYDSETILLARLTDYTLDPQSTVIHETNQYNRLPISEKIGLEASIPKNKPGR